MTTQQKPTLKTTKQPATVVSFDWLVRLPDKPKQKVKSHAQR
jgi:hypothetical protein